MMLPAKGRGSISVRGGAAIVLLLAALMRTLWLGEIPPGFQFDEAHNAIDAARWLDGLRPLFLVDNGGREVLLTWLHVPLLAALGRDHPVLAMRLVSAFIGLVTVALSGMVLGRILGDRRVGWLAAFWLSVLPWHLHFSRYAIRAILAPLWATAAFGAWWLATRPTFDPGRENPDASLTDMASGASARVSVASKPRWPPRFSAEKRPAPSWMLWSALTGACLAGAVWSHPSGRLLPLVLLAHVAWRSAAGRGRNLRRDGAALTIAAAVAIVLFTPLALDFAANPALFTAHPSNVSLRAVAAREHEGHMLSAVWSQIVAITGMFFIAGDPSTIHNVPDVPVFDPFSALWFLIGLGVLGGTLLQGDPRSREAAVLLLLWVGVGLLPTLLSDRAPNYSRAIVALPPLMAIVALGFRWSVSAGMSHLRLRTATTVLAVTAALAWGSWWTFVAFPRIPHAHYSYDQDKVEAVDALVAQAQHSSVFLAPVWAEQATIAYLLSYVHTAESTAESNALVARQKPPSGGDPVRSARGVEFAAPLRMPDAPLVRGLDMGEGIVWPNDGRDVLLAWPAASARDKRILGAIDTVLGGLAPAATQSAVGARDTHILPTDDERRPCEESVTGRDGIIVDCVRDSLGKPLLVRVRLPAALFGDMEPPRDAPLEPTTFTTARFGDAIELVGYSTGPAIPGSPLAVTLVWRAIAPLSRDLTTFLHLVGQDGQPWGQQDQRPVGGTWPTDRWRSGELIIDRFEPVLDGAAVGTVHPVIGWYELSSGERLTVGAADHLALDALTVNVDAAVTTEDR